MRQAIVSFGIVTCIFACLEVIGCAGLSAQDKIEIAQTGVTIAACQQLGRDCKADGGTDCFGVYDACMKDGGMR